MQKEEDFPMLPEGSRAPNYGYVYQGGFKDKNPEIRAVGLTFNKLKTKKT
jgi:hypothetical protein